MNLALTLAFAALALLAVLALLWSRWPMWSKALLAAGVVAFWFVADELAHRMWGWPSPDSVPERFVLLATVVHEPSRGNNGALYVWVNALEEGRAPLQPRAYRLPYTKDLHAMLDASMRRAREGIRQVGTAPSRPGGWLLGAAADGRSLKVRDLPVPELPEK